MLREGLFLFRRIQGILFSFEKYFLVYRNINGGRWGIIVWVGEFFLRGGLIAKRTIGTKETNEKLGLGEFCSLGVGIILLVQLIWKMKKRNLAKEMKE